MHLISIFLFVLSSNLDSLVLGVSYGMKRIHIRCRSNLLIALITFGGTMLSMLFGKGLLTFLPERLAGLLGSVLIIVLGLYGLVRFYLSRRQPNINFHGEVSSELSCLRLRGTVALGLVLTVNNIGIGIGASIAGLNVLASSIACFLCSFFLLSLGNYFGRRCLSHVSAAYGELMASAILIALGVYELFV